MADATMTVTLDLPATWGKLPEQERNGLLRAGVYEATQARIRQLQAEITACKRELRRFERRYGMPLARFEAEQLPHLDTLQAHEDYTDWFYWLSVLDEKQKLLASLQRIDAS